MGRFDGLCQSCSMPLEKDPGGGGTNADGSRSKKYCSFCYQRGQFQGNFKTAKDMQNFLKAELKKQGFGPLRRWFYTALIPKLERWNKK